MRIEAADEAMFRERDAWRYDPPYDFYDGDGLPVKNPEFFFAVRDDEGALVGFYFFAPDGMYRRSTVTVPWSSSTWKSLAERQLTRDTRLVVG